MHENYKQMLLASTRTSIEKYTTEYMFPVRYLYGSLRLK